MGDCGSAGRMWRYRARGHAQSGGRTPWPWSCPPPALGLITALSRLLLDPLSAPAGLKDVRGFAEMESRFLGPKARPSVLSTWQAGCEVRAFSLQSLRVKPAPPPGSGTAQVCKSLLGDCRRCTWLGSGWPCSPPAACLTSNPQPSPGLHPAAPPNPPLLLLPPWKSGCSQTKPPAPR